MTEKSQIKLENALHCLRAMYEASTKTGSFRSVSEYAKRYGMSPYIGQALEQENIVKKNGVTSSCTYTWIKSEPSEQMVMRLFERITNINRANTNRTKKPVHVSTISSTLVKPTVTINIDDLFDFYELCPASLPKAERREFAKRAAKLMAEKIK